MQIRITVNTQPGFDRNFEVFWTKESIFNVQIPNYSSIFPGTPNQKDKNLHVL